MWTTNWLIKTCKSSSWTQGACYCRLFCTSICQNCRDWRSNKTFLLNFVTSTNSRSCKWTQTPCTFFFLKSLSDCNRPELKAEWGRVWSNSCDDSLTEDTSGNFLPGLVARNTGNMTRESRVSSKKISGVRKGCVAVVKIITALILSLTS